ncbi:MAG: beta-lactamase family protein [Microthrixaceae bacterium]|nr:beta-lactamase family protein [Microthrixaceae bacterium]
MLRWLTVPILTCVALLGGACSDTPDPVAGDGGNTSGHRVPDRLVVDIQSSSVSPELSVRFEAALAAVMHCDGVPGAVVSVDLGGAGGGRWVATAGVSDIESGDPMTADLQWPIRSITKSFTVTLLLQLVDEGLVSLDDTIDTWVEGIPGGDSITLGELADMTSGVPDYTGEAFVEDFTADPTARFTRQQLLDYVREGQPSAPPGAERRYINSSTVLLGEVVEQVGGEPFAELLEQRVTDALGLDDTFYPDSVEGFTDSHATGYQPDGDNPSDGDTLDVAPVNFTVFDTAGAMISSAEDLEAWAAALGRGDLLATATAEQRFDASPLVEGPEYDSYGMGIGELDQWWGHTGEGFGYTTLVMYDPTSGARVVALMNVSGLDQHPPTKLFRRIAGILQGSDGPDACGSA